MMADAQCAKFIGGQQDTHGAWRNMALFIGSWTINGFSNFSIIEKSTGKWVGRAGPWQPADWPGAEIGWALVRSAWGKGYATEAATACMNWVFDDLGWDKVTHVIAPENTASIAVAERLGSKLMGPGRLPAPLDNIRVDLYGQSRQQWQERVHKKRSTA